MKLDEDTELKDFMETLLEIAQRDYRQSGSVLNVLYIFPMHENKIYMVFLSQVEEEIRRNTNITDPVQLKNAAFATAIEGVKKEIDIRSYVLMAFALCPKNDVLHAKGIENDYPSGQELLEKYGSFRNAPREYVEDVLLIEAGDRWGNHEAYVFVWNGKKFEKLLSHEDATRLQSATYDQIFRELIN